jgi:peptide deformylase
MTVRSILRMGDPRLQQIAEPVSDFGSGVLQSLLQDMRDTMQAMNGAGLAAPQIGVPLRVVIFGFRHNARYPEAGEVPETVLINPQITPVGEAREDGWEGCLSLPGLRGLVPRFSQIHYTGHDADGALIARTVSGFHARVVQHECDHLDGILYPMRMPDMSKFGFTAELFPDKQAPEE